MKRKRKTKLELEPELNFGDKLRRTSKAIGKLTRHWVCILGLKWWNEIKIQTYNTALDMPSNHRESTAFATFEWEYKIATVGFCLERMVDSTPKEIEAIVVHELGHLLVAPMRDRQEMGQRIEELTVTNLAQALLWAVGVYRKAEVGEKDSYEQWVGRLIKGADR